MAGGRGDRAVEDLQQGRFAGTVRADDAKAIARADQPRHVVEDLTASHGDLLRRGRDLRRGLVGVVTRLVRLLLGLPGGLRRLSRLGHAGIHQPRIGQIVDGDLHAAVRLRLGIHGRHHVHARGRSFHFRHIRIDIGLSLRMFEDLRHIDEIDHLFAETRRGHLLQLQRVAHRWHVGDELARRLDMELLLGGTGAGATGQPGKLLASQVAALRLAHVGLAVALHALQHIRGISAFERVDHAVVDLPHRFAYLVEEPTVVGDEQQRALAGRPTVLQVLGEPVDGHHVQMVRGLVKRENVPVLEQQAGKVGAAALTAGQGADLRVQTDAAEQRFDDFTRFGFRGPLVIFSPFQRGFAHRGVVIERVTLVEHAERQSIAHGHATGIRLLRAFEQMQQCRFAVAVFADDADAVAFENALRHIGENILGRESERNVFKSQIISRHNSPM